VILKQYYLGCLAHASHLVGDEGSGVAAVADAQRDVDQDLEAAVRQKLEIRPVLLTHAHTDFASAHLEFTDQVGALIHLGAGGKAEFHFTPVKDGDTVRLGDANTLLGRTEDLRRKKGAVATDILWNQTLVLGSRRESRETK
jgi:hydroxyacylglutathione hydrolase